ncbi:hypothetical protein AT864_01493 [Anoxybacillus sp. P3H1B]|nr:hypothetical protein [Anoxybacillus sp. P3H1B]KXG09933.1 hypothetical protein AT864_01493 [Anoxybacillus sp. P3H1B]
MRTVQPIRDVEKIAAMKAELLKTVPWIAVYDEEEDTVTFV